MQQLLAHVNRIARSEIGHRDDAELLARFTADRDELAFTTLVRRHGPLVLGVCRRWLVNPADAEDAFQAVFLVLARRATEIGHPDRLEQWLYGTAVRTAKHLRERLLRQQRHVKLMAALPSIPVYSAWPEPDLGGLLDEELNRLTEKYRLPVILCLLHGVPRREAAQRLQIPEGTLSTRLAEARTRLRRRLLQRGVVPAVASLLLAGRVEAVSPALVRLTVQAAMLFANSASAVAPAAAVSIAQGVLRMFAVQRSFSATVVLLVVLLFGVGATLLVGQHAVTPVAAADPPAKAPVMSTALKAGPGELLLVLHPTPDQSQMGHVVIVEEQDQFVAHSLRGLRKFLTRLRAAEKTPPTTITLVTPAEAKASAVNDVVGVCRDAGFARIVMQTEPRKAESTAAVDRAERYRRLTLDLLGRLPTPEELKAWLSDTTPDAAQKLIDELLQREEMTREWKSWFDRMQKKDSDRKNADEIMKSLQKMIDDLIQLEKKPGTQKDLAADLKALIDKQQKHIDELRLNRNKLQYLDELNRAQDLLNRDMEKTYKDAVEKGLDWIRKSSIKDGTNLQGVWLPKEVKVDGQAMKGDFADRFRWLIVEDNLISFAQGKPLLGRILADKNGPGSLEVTFVAESADAPKFTGKYTLKDEVLSVELEGSANPRNQQPAKLAITFTRSAEKRPATK